MEQPLVSVVVATYNGGKFVREQLISVLNQTYPHLEVVVFDDGSTDDTLSILQEMASGRSNVRIFSNQGKAGVVQNFGKGMQEARGKYIALCDQDDVWLPHKIEISLTTLQKLEQRLPAGSPALVFTDLKVVNEQLQEINASYWAFMGLNPKNNHFNKALVENVATGCTILCNRATVNQALPIPREALMHDVWLLLTASYFGQVTYISEPTVLYRQHNLNAIGARKKGIMRTITSLVHKFLNQELSLLSPELEQAKAFARKHQQNLSESPKNKVILDAFLALERMGPWARKKQIVAYSFFRSSWLKTFSLILRG